MSIICANFCSFYAERSDSYTENLDKKQNREKSTIENGIWAQQKCGGAFCASATTFQVSIVDFSTVRPA